MINAECPKVVAVIDDDGELRDAIAEVLEDYAFHPVTLANGREALDRLRRTQCKPCLILLDLMMPEMDGWQFRAQQEHDPDLGTIPVVVLSAHANAQEAARGIGAAGYLRKPVTLDALLAIVNRFCSHAA